MISRSNSYKGRSTQKIFKIYKRHKILTKKTYEKGYPSGSKLTFMYKNETQNYIYNYYLYMWET